MPTPSGPRAPRRAASRSARPRTPDLPDDRATEPVPTPGGVPTVTLHPRERFIVPPEAADAPPGLAALGHDDIVGLRHLIENRCSLLVESTHAHRVHTTNVLQMSDMRRPESTKCRVSRAFLQALDFLVRESTVMIDRPSGSAHPRYTEIVYPVDYGYLEGTVSGDGAAIDVFRGSATGVGLAAVAFTVDVGKRDLEAKILLDCTPTEIDEIVAFLTNRLGLGVGLVETSA